MAKNDLESIIALARRKGLDPDQLRDLVRELKHPNLNSLLPPIDLSHLVSGQRVRLGVIADTQLNSVADRVERLHEVYDMFHKEGVVAVLHPGDFTDGHQRYKGHVSEVKHLSYDDVVKYVVKNYPKVGIPTYLIAGNDDKSYLAKMGVDVCQDIADYRGYVGRLNGITSRDRDRRLRDHRDDLIYIGMNHRRIRIGSVTIELNHPRTLNRGAYTTSYPGERLVSSYQSGSKPDVLILGGYHRVYRAEQRGIKWFMVGTTADQTASMMTKRHPATCAAMILDIELDGDGSLKELQRTLVPLYR